MNVRFAFVVLLFTLASCTNGNGVVHEAIQVERKELNEQLVNINPYAIQFNLPANSIEVDMELIVSTFVSGESYFGIDLLGYGLPILDQSPLGSVNFYGSASRESFDLSMMYKVDNRQRLYWNEVGISTDARISLSLESVSNDPESYNIVVNGFSKTINLGSKISAVVFKSNDGGFYLNRFVKE